MQPQAGEVFGAIARDMTVPKVSTTPGASSTGGAQVLTTSPGNVKVEVLNGSGVSHVASAAAAGLTSRGFNVTGTGDAPNFTYTKSVIEYSTAADMPAVNTLMKELTNVTSLQVRQPRPGHGRPDPRLRLHRASAAQPAGDRHAHHRASQASSGASPSASGVRVRRGRPGPVQRRHHRRRGVLRRQLGLLRPAQSLTHWP